MESKCSWKDAVALTIATWFGSGLIPSLPIRGITEMAGTYGSFFALPLCWLLLRLDFVLSSEAFGSFYAISVPALMLLGSLSIPRAENALGPRRDWRGKTKNRDQNQIVIDEVVGMLVACLPLLVMPVRSTVLALFVAFVFFRLFDIIKPWPADVCDRVKSPVGVMLDDVVAGLYAALCLAAIVKLFRI